MSSFFCSAQCFWNLPILLHLSVAYPFSLLSTVLWCESNTICSFIHQLIDALVAFIWGCYEKTCYNNICGYRNFVYTYVFISLAKIYRRWVVGLGSRYVFSIIRNSIFFLTWVYLSASLLPMRDGYSVSTSLATFSNSTPFNFSHSNKCSSISVILNCISSKTSEIIAFSCTYLPCAYPPLVKHLFQSILYPFTIYLLYLLFTSKSFLYI